MSLARVRVWYVALLIVLSAGIAPAQSLKQVILQGSAQDLDNIRSRYGVAVVDAVPGYYLLAVSSSVDTHGMGPGVEDNSPLHIQKRTATTSAASNTASANLSILGGTVDWFGTPARAGYTTQPAVGKIQLNNALNVATGTGINVAIIDTGVDYQHPTLQGVLLGGRNYVGRTPVPSELDDPAVAQSTTSILDQSTTSILDQSTTSILDQSTTSILDQFSLNHLPGEFGHGTMMAGLVHLVAPRAKIIPLKAFDADGTGSEWNIIRAINDAVAMNANVISMSF